MVRLAACENQMDMKCKLGVYRDSGLGEWKRTWKLPCYYRLRVS